MRGVDSAEDNKLDDSAWVTACMDVNKWTGQRYKSINRNIITHQRSPLHDKTLLVARLIPDPNVLRRQDHLRRVIELNQDSAIEDGYLLLSIVQEDDIETISENIKHFKKYNWGTHKDCK